MLSDCASLGDSGLDIYLKEALKQGRANPVHFKKSPAFDFDPTEEQKYRIKNFQHYFPITRAHTLEWNLQEPRKKNVGFKMHKEIKRLDRSCYGQKSDLEFLRQTTFLILPQVEVRQEE